MPNEKTSPEPPSDLGPAGHAVWSAVFAEGQIEDCDAMAVARLGRLEDEAEALRDVLRRDGHVVRKPIQNSRGQTIGSDYLAHPAIPALRKIGTEAQILSDSLGLTPSGRKRLGKLLNDPQPPDWLDDLKSRRAKRLGIGG